MRRVFTDLFPESEGKIVISCHEHVNKCKKKIKQEECFFGSGLKSDFSVFLEKHDICKAIKKKKVFSGTHV